MPAPGVAQAVEPDQAPATKKAKSGRKPLPQNLPRVRVEHDVADSDKVCACGCQKSCIGEETSEQLDIIPAVKQLLVHMRLKYACKDCESGVAIAALPPQPIPKSNARTVLLAHIATAKYQNGLPLYRMEAIFKQKPFEDPHICRGTKTVRAKTVRGNPYLGTVRRHPYLDLVRGHPYLDLEIQSLT